MLYLAQHMAVCCISPASFLIGQALLHPFKNKLINLLDSWLLLNLAVVYVTLWFINLRKATILNMVANIFLSL